MNLRAPRVTTSGGFLLRYLASARALLLAGAVPAIVWAQRDVVPPGWFKTGNAPQDYEVGTDAGVRRSARRAPTSSRASRDRPCHRGKSLNAAGRAPFIANVR